MFDICLFDLDDTLIRTEDLKWDREACKNNCNPDLLANVRSALDNRRDRHIYSMDVLINIRSRFRNLKLGVFTRSPRSYAETVLNWAYPGFIWDTLIAYEDVERTKPYGDGINKAMDDFSIEYLDRVLLVGDSDVDLRSGYHCGCVVALDKSAWPQWLEQQHWNALGLIPDAVISYPMEILDVLNNPHAFLPELERVFMKNASSNRVPRFDRINHFIPQSVGGQKKAYPIDVCGRSFASYKCLQYRKQWHRLTESIEENKESDSFPEEWIKAVRAYIKKEYSMLFGNLVVAVIPHRPGRTPRLENFLKQLEISIQSNPINRLTISFQPQLLAYNNGVKSQHGDYLDHRNRFINVQKYLTVSRPEIVKSSTSYLIIDDVTTTGASLIYASKYLRNDGAYDVRCLSMAKNITRIL